MAFPVSVIQLSIDAGDVESNRASIATLGSQAVRDGAKLVLFPEAAVSDVYRGAEALAESIPGPSTQLAMSLAGHAVIALPLLEKAADGKLYSSCAFVDARGVRAVTRKTHLYRDSQGHDTFRDADLLSAGNELSVIDLGDVKVGVLLGFDAEFPEAFRTLALRGADLILCALNQLEPDLNLLQAMAVRNRVPILAANRLGFRRVYPAVPEFSAAAMSLVQERDGSFLMRCRGNSAIIDASGALLARPAMEPQRDVESIAGARFAPQPIAHFQEDEILNASFRIDDLRVQRATTPYLAERRPELYS